jgi:hypothetical protein
MGPADHLRVGEEEQLLGGALNLEVLHHVVPAVEAVAARRQAAPVGRPVADSRAEAARATAARATAVEANMVFALSLSMSFSSVARWFSSPRPSRRESMSSSSWMAR